ncbi:glyoxylase-like metal-dependent hydrolase (beta-lactamase superfamily II) [Bradyrhizobium sp. LA6.10]|uniref:hypothetical protein n=1 Tax=Bradyrhizobium sp. LA6.10 TaxID=3156318 RepID=UPI00339B5A07
MKTVIVTYGYVDHYGGANYFARKYDSRIVASEADCKLQTSCWPQSGFISIGAAL